MRLIETSGIVALPDFGSNRYLREEPEKGKRIPVDHVEYRFHFRIFSHHSHDLDTSLYRYIAV